MNISNINDSNAQFIQQSSRGASGASATDRPVSSALMKPEEKVNLSTTAREIQQAKVEMSGLPDVREEKVQAIRFQVVNGAYNVSGAQIANKMVGESLLDLFA
ncbi:MAG: flagellar biosynthesis anti-sigma factor FlgM [Syntrophaceae bacterium]|nr:flagellar biosynthesis anti-sigma factor FlgM [Syntrophaceae bacterium]